MKTPPYRAKLGEQTRCTNFEEGKCYETKKRGFTTQGRSANKPHATHSTLLSPTFLTDTITSDFLTPFLPVLLFFKCHSGPVAPQ